MNAVPMTINPAAAAHIGQSSGPFFSLRSGSFISVPRQCRGLGRRALFFFDDRLVYLPRHRRASRPAKSAILHHDNHDISRVFIGTVGIKPGDSFSYGLPEDFTSAVPVLPATRNFPRYGAPPG